MDSFISSNIASTENMATLAASIVHASPSGLLELEQAPSHMFLAETGIQPLAKDGLQVAGITEALDFPATASSIPAHLIDQLASLSSSVATPSESPFLAIDVFDECTSSGTLAAPPMHHVQQVGDFRPQRTGTPLTQIGDLPISAVGAPAGIPEHYPNMFAFPLDPAAEQLSAALVADAVAAVVSPAMVASTGCLDPQALHAVSRTPFADGMPGYLSQHSEYPSRSSTPLVKLAGSGLNPQYTPMTGLNPKKLNHRLDRIRPRRALSIGGPAALQAAMMHGLPDHLPQTCQYPHFSSPCVASYRPGHRTPLTSSGVVRHHRSGSENILVSPYQSAFSDSYLGSSRDSSTSPQMGSISRRPRGHSLLSTTQGVRSPKLSGMSDFSDIDNDLQPRKQLTEDQKNTYFTWLYKNRHDPKPKGKERERLRSVDDMSPARFKTWFANARRRYFTIDTVDGVQRYQLNARFYEVCRRYGIRLE
ncbi:hypothetical protein DL89DRAFT_23010 [Linderina pennispora]|uniref:Homeobox domain-containing protein n=1 Tax=Linderina pennispora TaxID=61395 RepID=A0A1Y1WMM6_9FUNG|nr:uncharacterized protein DL89DRAFT_23010 [Linderina pennispora]ORX74809.1 hypothetical protein DL89DRAFT_23010 [Linderina pennispora]